MSEVYSDASSPISNSRSPIAESAADFVSKDVVAPELHAYFKRVLSIIVDPPLEGSLLHDCAWICALLQSTDYFDRFYREKVDPRLADAYVVFKEKFKEDPSLKKKGGALLQAFRFLMEKEGFAALKGIVFTGDAPHIREITRNHLLFKDSTGPTHGEFTHSLQWLTICFWKKENLLVNRVADIYAILMDYVIRRINQNGAPEVGLTKSAELWPGELFFGAPDTRLPDKPKVLWDFVVDAFAASDRKGTRMGSEITLSNLYTDSYRCPARLLIAIQSGTLNHTFIGKWWAGRVIKYEGFEPRLKPKRPWFDIDNYRQMIAEKQRAKGKTPFYPAEWAAEPWWEEKVETFYPEWEDY
ncbi:LirA/MavJ family T4SS effector [Paraburkholderia sp. J10-1]|uniref:LirA/MavJ family T4SS effector n=1 Tax=Paraburkholderia sp. J10-1 TaxID=2805430 RepID=UPI002AB61135|nr:LirA/MavJ family T4SS effector [Paraburkholderia sp. J10-1]